VKPRQSSLPLQSFQDFKDLVEVKSSFPLKCQVSGPSVEREVEKKNENPEPEENLFAKAMEGVTPFPENHYVQRAVRVKPPERARVKEDAETLAKLTELVKYGKGFNVSDTPEYIEGIGYQVPPAVVKRLHRGDYSIDAHLDLHGFSAEAAKERFEEFLKRALLANKKGVLIIHGRGLCSPSEPVLKKKVEEWLTRGPFRKWVVAYCSARIYDGGAGATYVLLRGRPVSKRFKIGKVKPARKLSGY